MIDGALISALAALSGTALGWIAPIASNYLIQKGQTERELLAHELNERQALYSEFIKVGIALYVSVATKDPKEENVGDLVELHALLSRIRLYASEPVIEAAQDFAAIVTECYSRPANSLEDLLSATRAGHVNPLRIFSIRCREELREVFRRRSPVIS
jgi:hypothetical protein